MLDLFRRKQRGLKWTLWIVIFGLGAGMVLLFVDTPSGVSGSIGTQNVATVDGRPIDRVEFHQHYVRLYDFYRQVYKLDQQDPNIIKQLGLGRQALNQLITDYALLLQAERMGIVATTSEIQQRITSAPSFQQNGKFIGRERYTELLRLNNMTPAQFEEGVRRDVVREKFRNILTDAIFTTPEEVRQEYLNRNQEVKVRYVSFDTEQLGQSAVDEQELRKYFQTNKENFKRGEQRKVRYIAVEMNPNAVKVTEEQIRSRLAIIPAQEQVRASHILIKAEKPEQEAEAKKKAEEILVKVRAGADFADLAKEFSQDPGSAVQGGDLGFFRRGTMMPEFEQAAFSLSPGQISDLVKTPFGYHIIKVTAKPKDSPQSRRPIAELQVRQEESDKLARNLATRILYELRRAPKLEEVAKKYGRTVQETPYFTLGDTIAGLQVPSDFNQKIFALKKGDLLGEAYLASGRYVIVQLADIKAPEIPRFEHVRDRVLQDFKTTRGETMARERAFAIQKAAQGKPPSDFEQLAKKEGLPVTTTGFFKKGSTIDDTLKFSPEVHDRSFRMKPGEVSAPIKVTTKYVVFQVVEKSTVDLQKFEQEKAQLAKELANQKRTTFFEAYLQNLVERLRAENKIIINQELVNQITG